MSLECNTTGNYPEVAAGGSIHPRATLIGKVVIGDKVLVCPNAVIRADEPGPGGAVEPIVIGDGCNIQDGVIIHALGGTGVTIGKGTSVAHGAIIHGPCEIADNCFIGFGSVVFKATLGRGVVVLHKALVEGVNVPGGVYVPSMTVVSCEEDVNRLPHVTPEITAFVDEVRRTNLRFAEARLTATDGE